MEDPPGILEISALDHPPVVIVRRLGGVSDDFWLRVLSEWGAVGSRPAERTEVARERLLSNLAWLRPACQQHRVGLSWNDLALQLVRSADEDRGRLQAALSLEDTATQAGHEILTASRFSGELRPFQVRDLDRLSQIGNGANFSVPGAGKTAVTLALHEVERTRGRVDRLLVVCPISAFESWLGEAARWLSPAPEVALLGAPGALSAEVLLVNYQRLDSGYEEITSWVSSGRTHVVLDEAHRIKQGWAGQWGRSCLRLAYLAARRDVLTGTPAPQHPRDLVALFDFCWPGRGRSLLPAECLVSNPPRDAVERAGEAVRPLFVRTTKVELDLRPPRSHAELVPMGPLHLAIYEALRVQYSGAFTVTPHDQASFTRFGRVVMYLLEAATNPALLPAGSAPGDPLAFRHPPLEIPEGSRLASLLADYGNLETPSKFARLAALLDENVRLGRKTLVWSNFVRNLDYLANDLLAGLHPALIHGGIPYLPRQGQPRNRRAELERFRTDPDCHVLLANPAAMGEGVSLHDVCHDAIYLERTFNAGQYLQSVDRIHRLGLPRTTETRITLLLSTGTVDEVVDRRVREKSDRLAVLMDDQHLTAMALPDEDDYSEPLDSEIDLLALFSHLKGEDI